MDNTNETLKGLTLSIQKQDRLLNNFLENNQKVLRILNLITAQLKLKNAKRDILEHKLFEKL